MKYYIADDEDPKFAAAEQRSVDYLHSVWDELPPAVRLPCDRRAPFSPERVYLNDSNVQSVRADFTENSVTLTLLGEALDRAGTQIGTRLFTLTYGGVRSLTCGGEYTPEDASALPFGLLFADHIWDEFEVLEPGLLEHRMLFAHEGRAEWSVVFSEFSIAYSDQPLPHKNDREDRS